MAKDMKKKEKTVNVNILDDLVKEETVSLEADVCPVTAPIGKIREQEQIPNPTSANPEGISSGQTKK